MLGARARGAGAEAGGTIPAAEPGVAGPLAGGSGPLHHHRALRRPQRHKQRYCIIMMYSVDQIIESSSDPFLQFSVRERTIETLLNRVLDPAKISAARAR